MNPATVWSGQWVADHVGLELVSSTGLVPLPALVGLALRRNPKRAHLLVSTVLGKHVPVSPAVVRASGTALAALVADVLEGNQKIWFSTNADELTAALQGDATAAQSVANSIGVALKGAADVAVIGFAETATGLGQEVAQTLGVWGIHSTRRRNEDIALYGGFEESHSHATSHYLQPRDQARFDSFSTFVLVDDELSTGNTAIGLIRSLHASHPRKRFVVASLIDGRSAADRTHFAEVAAELGVVIDCVALASGVVNLPPDLAERAQVIVEEVDRGQPALADTSPTPTGGTNEPGQPGHWKALDVAWPSAVPTSSRFGADAIDAAILEKALSAIAFDVLAQLDLGNREPVLVLGTEECMYLPARIAHSLEQAVGADHEVTFSSTTRSPVLALDEPGYAIGSACTFVDPEGSGTPRFAYNLHGASRIVVVADSVAAGGLDLPGGLLPTLVALGKNVHLLVLPEDEA